MEKIYQTTDVYTALQSRLDYIFTEFDNIYISFSGGKESGMLYQLVIRYMQEHGIRRKIGLLHWDVEVQYARTTEYVDRTFANAPDYVDRFWGCIPFAIRDAMSQSEPWWYPWDPDKDWVRPMPDYPYVYNLSNNPFDFYRYKMPLEHNVYVDFDRWYQRHCGGGKTVSLIGIRADESLHRYNAIINKKHCHGGQKYITVNGRDVCTAAPLYDWTVEDVWTAIGKFGLDYNAMYDLYYQAGVPLTQMRVASPYIEWAVPTLKLYRVLEPDTWAKAIDRIDGVNFGAIYGDTEAMGYKEVRLPKGYTWQTYTEYLLSTLPEDTRRIFQHKFEGRTDWKTMCACILKNDIRGKTLSERKSDTSASKSRLKSMMRGGRYEKSGL